MVSLNFQIAPILLAIAIGSAGVIYVANVRSERDKAIKEARQHYELYQTQKRVNADLVNASIKDKQLQQAAVQNTRSAAINKEAFKNATSRKETRQADKDARLQPRVEVASANPGDCHLTVDAVRVLNASLAGQAIDRSAIDSAEGQATSTVSCRAVGEVLIDTASQYHDLASKHDALVDSVCRSDAGGYNPGCSQYESSSPTTSSSFGE